jgi:hypothetical protein
MMDAAQFVNRRRLEDKYERPLSPYILYNDNMPYRNLSSLTTNKQLTNKFQPDEVRSCIRGLLKQFAEPTEKKRLGLSTCWGFVFEYEGRPELICENEGKLTDTVIFIRLEDILYPPLEPRETMLITGALFLCAVGICKFIRSA